jgi:hypothetical protein
MEKIDRMGIGSEGCMEDEMEVQPCGTVLQCASPVSIFAWSFTTM